MIRLSLGAMDRTKIVNLPNILDIVFGGLVVTVCRFTHRGKRATQAVVLRFVEKMLQGGVNKVPTRQHHPHSDQEQELHHSENNFSQVKTDVNAESASGLEKRLSQQTIVAGNEKISETSYPQNVLSSTSPSTSPSIISPVTSPPPTPDSFKGYFDGLLQTHMMKETKNSYMLFLDPNVQLDPKAIQSLVNCMKSSNGDDKVACSGRLTHTPESLHLWHIHDFSHLASTMMDRSVETAFGGTMQIHGGMVMFNLRILKELQKTFFNPPKLPPMRLPLFLYLRGYVGSDWYLAMTTLNCKETTGFKAVYNESAVGMTDAPANLNAYFMKRRVEILGGLVNEVTMLVSGKLWQKVSQNEPITALKEL
jgi:hypothetical protein